MASHAVLKEQLIEMGFEDKLIQGALHLLKDKATLESVIEAIENGTAEVEATKIGDNPTAESTAAPEAQPTPEEFEARKKAMEEKIKQRRLEMEEKEKEEEKLREIQRRKDGKDMGKMREEIDRIQKEKFVENLKREKAEEKAARDAILRKIEQDKAERRARAAGTSAAPTPAPTPIAVAPTISSNVSKDGKTKLAIRLLDGSTIMQEFDAKEVLSVVRAWVVTQKGYMMDITFTMPGVGKIYVSEDFEKPLHALGLVPNARLQVVKR